MIIASTLLNAGYFAPIVYRAFFVAPPAGDHAGHGDHSAHAAHGEAPWPMVVALVATAAGTIALFFMPELPLALARQMLAGT